MSIDKSATSKSVQLSSKVSIKLLPLLDNDQRLNFVSLREFAPSPRLHPHSDSIISAHITQVKISGLGSIHSIDMAMQSGQQAKTLTKQL